MSDIDSIWHYFSRAENNYAKCKHCNHSANLDATKSTGNLIRHLSSKHPDLDNQRKKEIEKKKKKRDRAVESLPKLCWVVMLFPSSSCRIFGCRLFLSDPIFIRKTVLVRNYYWQIRRKLKQPSRNWSHTWLTAWIWILLFFGRQMPIGGLSFLNYSGSYFIKNGKFFIRLI